MHAIIPPEESPREAKFYLWSFPGAPIQVYVHFDVVLGIRARLQAGGATSASAQGLLLGKIAAPGLCEITEFRFLSSGNPDALKEALSVFQNSPENLRPLGYFRTHAGDRLALSEADLALAQAHFPDPNCVFLLIQPSATAAWNAGFFYWDGGKMNGGFHDFCFLEFPFDVSLLSPSKPGDLKEVPDPAPAASLPLEPPPPANDAALSSTTLPVPVSSIDAWAAPKPRSRWRTVRLAATAILLAIAGFAAGIFITQKLARIVDLAGNAAPTPIALKAEHQGSDLLVTWNHNSPVVTSAESGQLTIFDGGARAFSLDQSHIRSGSVVYSPVTDQVRVQLDLKAPDQRIISESVMVILKKPAAVDSPAVVAQPPAQPAKTPSPRAFLDSGDTRTTRTPAPLPDDTPARARKEFQPPPQRTETSSQSLELAPPPSVTGGNSALTAVPAPTLPSPGNQAPPTPAPKAAIPVSTGPPAPTPAPAPKSAPPVNITPQTPSRPSERLSDVLPAVPIEQRLPPPLTAAQK